MRTLNSVSTWKTAADGVPVDELTLRDAVIGDGLVLIPLRNDHCTLHAIHAGLAHCFGTALSTLEALRIVDELDARPEPRVVAA